MDPYGSQDENTTFAKESITEKTLDMVLGKELQLE